MFKSPLRYPGGKNKLAAFFAKICIDNKINGHYIEPYSGGASVALFLLLEGFVNKITINDKDRSIYAFWFAVLNHTESLCQLINETEVNVVNWHKQKNIQTCKETRSLLELGFSTLFLNRTNRSGIITGGIIGGQEQLSEHKIDCRFNKQDIIARIRAIASRKSDIRLFNLDAISLIDLIEKEPSPENSIFYFDPPYFLKASSLYMNHYKSQNHILVSEKIKAIKSIKWVVSYDNVDQIKNLYLECDKKEYSFSYTAGTNKTGRELLFFSPMLIKPAVGEWNPINFKVIRRNNGSVNIKYRVAKKLGENINAQSDLFIS
jgi:DNA adenine methylase